VAKVDNRDKYVRMASEYIEKFDLEKNNYRLVIKDENFIIKNMNKSNKIYIKDNISLAKYNIDFFNSENSTIYIGSNLKGNINIKVHTENSMVYIGNNCNLKKVIIDSNQKNDFIAIGNNVFANINNQWRSGLRSGGENPAIIIGDDCLFGADVLIRNTDAHPIYSIESSVAINNPKSIVLIEPYVWIGAKVNLLKDIKIGACSIIALGSIVTKEMPRFSTIKGVPAKGVVNKDLFWCLSAQPKHKKRAHYYRSKYL